MDNNQLLENVCLHLNYLRSEQGRMHTELSILLLLMNVLAAGILGLMVWMSWPELTA